MKTLYIILIQILFFLNSLFGQNWPWAKHIHSTGNDYAKVKCVDSHGNLYVIGTYTATKCIFDNDTISGTGTNKHFFAKYSSTGTLIWARTVASSSATQSCTTGLIDLVYDSISNSLLFAGSGCLPFTMGSTTITNSSGHTDAIIGKADLNGEIIWYQKISGKSVINPSKISYDNADNIYAICTNNTPLVIGNDTLPTGVFIVKYNSNGVKQFVKNVTTNTAFQSIDMHIIKGKIYLSGSGSSHMIVDTIHLVNPNSHGTLIAKLDLYGNAIWANLTGFINIGTLGFYSTVDSSGSIYTICTIQDSATFNGTKVIAKGARDIVIVKNDSNGNFVWLRQADYSISPGSLVWGAQAINIDKLQNIYLTGDFGGNAHFGNNTINSTNSRNLFLAKYTSTGDCIGVDYIENAKGVAITIDNNNTPIISGTFVNTVSIGNTSFTCTNTYDAFVAKHQERTGIKDLRRTTNNQLYIHANPNEGKCNITVPDEFAHEKNLVLSIYNSSGKLIQQKNLEMNEGKIKLSLEAEAKGLYNAVLSNGTKSYSGKIVFE